MEPAAGGAVCICAARSKVHCAFILTELSRQMAPWIKPAAGKSVQVLGKITLAAVAFTVFAGGMERAMVDPGKPIPGTTLKARKSGTF